MEKRRIIRLEDTILSIPFHTGKINVCSHIIINGVEIDDDYEYDEELNIHCVRCNKDYVFKVLIG